MYKGSVMINKIKTLEYAIVDIETTGGSAGYARITEIAILIHDGREVVERWTSLINPLQNIPLMITGLTGIDQEMVADAPTFKEVSKTVYAMLKDRVFVAHNVNFDYSFIYKALKECGIEWKPAKLCTVRLSRYFFKGFSSYSLGKLCDRLEIPISNRHRAGGDAEATAILFGRIVQLDHDDYLLKVLKRNAKEQRLPPNVDTEDYENIPHAAGVYYFHDKEGKVIYIGKAKDLKKRVLSHFVGNNLGDRRQKFLKEIYYISYIECGTELMALILECCEIRRLWPVYNRSLKNYEPQYGISHYVSQSGHQCLAVTKVDKQQEYIALYHRQQEAVLQLQSVAKDCGLDHRYCHYGSKNTYRTSEIKDKVEENKVYNEKVKRAIDLLKEKKDSYAIVDEGRNTDEKSVVYVLRGQLYGMGYISTDSDVLGLDDIYQYLQRYASSQYVMQLINSYRRRNPYKVCSLPEMGKNDFEIEMDTPRIGLFADQ